MSYNEIVTIIRQELKKSGYRFEERGSVSTSSVYFKIFSGEISLMFRISDHTTKKDVVTLRVNCRTDKKAVINFLKNRISDLQYRAVKAQLGIH